MTSINGFSPLNQQPEDNSSYVSQEEKYEESPSLFTTSEEIETADEDSEISCNEILREAAGSAIGSIAGTVLGGPAGGILGTVVGGIIGSKTDEDKSRVYDDGINRFEYDENGNNTKHVSYDGNGNVIQVQTFEYDENGNKTKMVNSYPDGTTWTYQYTYDQNGDYTGSYAKITDENGNTIVNESAKVGHPTIRQEYEYDENGHCTYQTYTIDEYSSCRLHMDIEAEDSNDLVGQNTTEPECVFENMTGDDITAEHMLDIIEVTEALPEGYYGYISDASDSSDSLFEGIEDITNTLNEIGINPEEEGFELHTDSVDGVNYAYYSRTNSDGSVEYLKVLDTKPYDADNERKVVYSKSEPDGSSLTTKVYDVEELKNNQ